MLKIKVKATRVAVDKVIKEYKQSKDFKQEVAKVCIKALHQGFLEFKKKVKQFFPQLDLKDVVESDDKGEEGEDGKMKELEEPVEVRAG